MGFNCERNPLKHMFDIHPLTTESLRVPKYPKPRAQKIKLFEGPKARMTPGDMTAPTLAREAARMNAEVARANRPVPQPIYYLPGQDGKMDFNFAAPRPGAEEMKDSTPAPDKVAADRTKSVTDISKMNEDRSKQVRDLIEAEHKKMVDAREDLLKAQEAARLATAAQIKAREDAEEAERERLDRENEEYNKQRRRRTHPMQTRLMDAAERAAETKNAARRAGVTQGLAQLKADAADAPRRAAAAAAEAERREAEAAAARRRLATSQAADDTGRGSGTHSGVHGGETLAQAKARMARLKAGAAGSGAASGSGSASGSGAAAGRVGRSGSGGPTSPAQLLPDSDGEVSDEEEEDNDEGDVEAGKFPAMTIPREEYNEVLQSLYPSLTSKDIQELIKQGYKPSFNSKTQKVRLYKGGHNANLPESLVQRYGIIAINNKLPRTLRSLEHIPYLRSPVNYRAPPPLLNPLHR